MRKIKYSSLGIVIIGLVIAGFAYMQNQSSADLKLAKVPALSLPQAGSAHVTDVEYIFEVETKNISKEAKVFEFKQVNMSNTDVQLIASKFNLKGKASLAPSGQYGLRDGTRFLMVDKLSGKYQFIDESLTDLDVITGPVELPSDDEAIRIAESHLQDMGLLRKDFTFAGIGKVTTGPDTDPKIIAKEVFFYRQLNGTPVLGVSRIIVTVGHKGQIASFDKLFKEIGDEVKVYPLRPIKEAMDDVRKNKGKTDLDERARKAIIKKVEVMYWEDAGSVEDQLYIQPVYRFEGDVILDDGSADTFHVVVPAIDPSYIKAK